MRAASVFKDEARRRGKGPAGWRPEAGRGIRCGGATGCRRGACGVEAVQGRGRLGGRPKRMTPIQEICAALGVSKSTLYRYVGPDGSVRTPLDKVNPPHDST